MTKDIIRFYKTSDRKQLIHSGVTLEQAKEWCSSPLTQKEGKYFDGFAEYNSYKTKNSKPKYTHYFAPSEEYN